MITHKELCYIRSLWLDEKHEFDDALPRIYKEVMGEEFEDDTIKGNKYYGVHEWDLLSSVCDELYPGYELLLTLESSLMDIESKNAAIGARKNVLKSLEAELEQLCYKDEKDAQNVMRQRQNRLLAAQSDFSDDSED